MLLHYEFRCFDTAYFDRLCEKASTTERGRQHDNLHANHSEPCQRLFNAVGLSSYIQPHRHAADPKSETLVAARGEFALLTFDDAGEVMSVCRFGGVNDTFAVELPPGVWHTVLALTPAAVLLEVKAGPFDPSRAKEVAPWSPAERTEEGRAYLERLRRLTLALSSRPANLLAER